MFEPRSLLFFPGTRPDQLPKALASDAGLVCVDLEDSVAQDEKGRARQLVIDLLGEAGEADRQRLAVRVNHPSTPEGVEDQRALRTLADDRRAVGPRPTIVVPKVSGVADVAGVVGGEGGARGAVTVIAMIETAAGLSRVEEIAAAEGVAALLFGGLDLSLELGCALAWEPLLYARSRCVLAARLAGVGLIDTPYFGLDDAAGLSAEARRARALGFTGKAAIHPRQVATIHEAFAPTEEEVNTARRVLSAQERSGEGVLSVDGSMVDRPVVDAARRLLERAERTGPRGGDGS